MKLIKTMRFIAAGSAGLVRIDLYRLFQIAACCLALSATFLSPMASADGTYKPDAQCTALDKDDITVAKNQSCKAVAAAYVNSDGKVIYFEILGDDQSGRLIKVSPTLTGSGCGSARCFKCFNGTCGCIC